MLEGAAPAIPEMHARRCRPIRPVGQASHDMADPAAVALPLQPNQEPIAWCRVVNEDGLAPGMADAVAPLPKRLDLDLDLPRLG